MDRGAPVNGSQSSQPGMSRVEAVEFGHVDYEAGRREIRWGTHRFRHSALAARVRSDDGAIGLGLAWAQIDDESAFARAGLSALASIVVGADALSPYETGRACQLEAYKAGIGRAASALEMALWDLASRRLGIPAYQLLGCKRRSLPAYVISAEEFAFREPEEFVDLAERYMADGFRACKFHLWGEAERDIAACDAIRKAVGDDIKLMLDPASRYGREDALRVGRAIEELGFVRYEDPLSPFDAAGYRWLAGRLSVPVMVNESLRWGIEECAAAARNDVVQGFRLEIGRAGVAHGFALAAVAEANGGELDIASLAPRGGLELCLHFGLASAPTRWFEHHEALGLEAVPGLKPGIEIENGVARPVELPGFGYAIDWTEFDRYCAWVR
jgi:L-alanine-DL-glutamate epimerase-like enolase superfamily enzyme